MSTMHQQQINIDEKKLKNAIKNIYGSWIDLYNNKIMTFLLKNKLL